MILVLSDLAPQPRKWVAYLVASKIPGCLMIIRDACRTCTKILDFFLVEEGINRNCILSLVVTTKYFHTTVVSNQGLLKAKALGQKRLYTHF